MLTGFLAIVFVFGLIVIVHEWGHMTAAKLCGVAVPDFAIGMGPSLWSRVWRGTRYHICAIPIGGYVQIAGQTGDDPLNKPEGTAEIPPEATDGGRLVKRWQDINGFQKAFILTAGVFMNFVLAFVVIILQGFVGFPDNTVMIGSVQAGKPAALAGVQAGDVVLALNGHSLQDLMQFSDIVASHPGQPAVLQLRRGKQDLTLSVVPQADKAYNGGKPSLGVGLQLVSDQTTTVGVVTLNSPASTLGIKRGDRIGAVNGEPVTDGLQVLAALASFDPQTLAAVDEDGKPIPAGGGKPVQLTIENKHGSHDITVPGDVSIASFGVLFTERLRSLPPGQALQRSLHDGAVMMGAILGSMKLLFTKVGAQSVSGPIGIFSMLGQSAQSDLYTFLLWVIVINVNLGMINLLPLPAFDGGRLVFVALAGMGIRITEKREALVHAAGMLMILVFAVLISVRDINGLIRGLIAH